jgi:hypothetical protein
VFTSECRALQMAAAPIIDAADFSWRDFASLGTYE